MRNWSKIKELSQGFLEYCDLGWEEECLNFHNNNRMVRTASSAKFEPHIVEVLPPLIDTAELEPLTGFNTLG